MARTNAIGKWSYSCETGHGLLILHDLLRPVNILREIQQRFASAWEGLADNPPELLAQVRASQDPKFGDYQANCAMPLGKRLGKPPREIAAEIVRRLEIADFCQPP